MRRRGLGRTMARTAVIAGTATAVSGHVARRQDAHHQQQQQAAAQAAHQPPPAPVDVAEELQKFAALRDQGILTEEEFAVQKARILSL
jgi:Short C-terminal domain